MKGLISILLFALTALSALAQRGETQQRELSAAKGIEVMFSIYKDVNLFYVDTVQPSELVEDAMGGMLSELDPYSEYIPSERVAEFQISTTGKYGGIGSLIRQRGEWVEIAEPYRGTPSDRAGLKAGDRLLEIDGTSLKSAGSQKVSDMLKGDPGTTFSLTYRPIADTTTTRTVDIKRERIAVPGVPYYGVVSDSIGYIRLDNFTLGAAKEVKNAIKEIESEFDIKGLILDLRGNGGGIVGESVDIVGLFVPQGTKVLEMRGKTNEMNATYSTTQSPVDLDLPLAVLINGVSASASEIVAGALQDLDRAVIIGTRSFGKGLVQSTRSTPYGGVLKLTTAKYYTPSGRCIQALDYAHREVDGSVGYIADSLKKEFTTVGGRKVYDGGGITPDINIENDYYSKFTAILIGYGFIDDFANIYAATHPGLDKDFVVSDDIYDDFVRFMSDKTIEYESLSSVKLKELREAAKREKYDSRIVEELDAIASKIKDDKDAELKEFKSEIVDVLYSAIATRLFYSSYAIERSLDNDPVVAEAVSVLDRGYSFAP